MGHEVFIPRRWIVAIVAVAVAVIVALLVTVVVQGAHHNDRQDARAAELQDQARIALGVNKALCTAIPNVAGRTAQSLVDILVADARTRHIPKARIQNTQRLGRLYVTHARALALKDLRACKQIKHQEAP